MSLGSLYVRASGSVLWRSMHKCVIFKAKTVLRDLSSQIGNPAPPPQTMKKEESSYVT